MTIDAVIPVYKPDGRLEQLLRMLNRQHVKPEKIVLMITTADGRPEESPAVRLAKESVIPTELHWVAKTEFDHGGTRNAGLSFCTAELVLFMTQDAVPEDDHMIEALIRPFEQPFCGAEHGVYDGHEIMTAYGRQMPAKDCRVVERYTRSFNYPAESRIKTEEDLPQLGIKTFFASNVCAAYKRELVLKQGGFPEHTIFNEDMIFAGHGVKAGYAIAYVSDARVIHSHNLSGREQFHRNFDLAVSQVENPDVFSGLRSEGEGIRLVKQTMSYLWKEGKWYLIPGLVWISGCKYLGYLMGKKYKRLPKGLVVKCSLNKTYWGNR